MTDVPVRNLNRIQRIFTAVATLGIGILWATTANAQLNTTKARVVVPINGFSTATQDTFPYRVLNAPVGSTYQFWVVTLDNSAPPKPLQSTATPIALPAGKFDEQSGMTVATVYPKITSADGDKTTMIRLRIYDTQNKEIASGYTYWSKSGGNNRHLDALNAFYVSRAGQDIVDYQSSNSSNGIVRAAGRTFRPEKAVWRTKGDQHGNAAPPCRFHSIYTDCDGNMVQDVSGGWFDAGDQGKYTVNAATALWHLFNLIERDLPYIKTPGMSPTSDADKERNAIWRNYRFDLYSAPENLRADRVYQPPQTPPNIPPILKEARYEMEWLLRMQIQDQYLSVGLPVGLQDVKNTKGYGVSLKDTTAQTYANYAVNGVQVGSNIYDPGSNRAVPLILQTLKYTSDIRPYGMVYHSVHDEAWTDIPTLPENNTQKRVLEYPTTAATLSLAAVGAQCYRIFQFIDPTFARQCFRASDEAFLAAYSDKSTPDYVYFYGEYNNPLNGPMPSIVNGGGAYADSRIDDLLYWARMERFLSSYVRDGGSTPSNRQMLRDMINQTGPIGTDGIAPGISTKYSFPARSAGWVLAYNWANNAALGSLSAITVLPDIFTKPTVTVSKSETDSSLISAPSPARNLISDVNDMATNAATNAWGLPISSSFNFEWGSNHELVNAAIFAKIATELDGKNGLPTLNSSAQNIPQSVYYYLFGSNALGRGMVTDVGFKSNLLNIHHRVFAREVAPQSVATPLGWMVGGPNGQIPQAVLSASRLPYTGVADSGVFNGGQLKMEGGSLGGYMQLMDVLKNCRDSTGKVRSATCYADHYWSYHTNEVAINWQASWLWLSRYSRQFN